MPFIQTYPPPQGFALDIEALSGILGSVSIACWVVVFSPQIIENFRRGSANGLSIVFIVIWLLGDVFNILGAVLQGVLPTMTILAVYYTIADVVLLLQCFYYRGFTLSDAIPPKAPTSTVPPSERTPLIRNGDSDSNHPLVPSQDGERRRSSFSSIREHILAVDGTHLSPATPLIRDYDSETETTTAGGLPKAVAVPQSTLQSVLTNSLVIIMVCAAGVFGWWISNGAQRDQQPEMPEYDPIVFNYWGQVFGYICAALYLGSRIPQLLLNYRRKSTEGISMLFFLFACIGNATYVLSIMAYSPVCRDVGHCEEGEAKALYGRYFLMNFSWLMGSFGTLILDGGVFVQYFMYRKDEFADSEEEEEDALVEDPGVEARVSRKPNHRRQISFEHER